jgi:hypothetical protein
MRRTIDSAVNASKCGDDDSRLLGTFVGRRWRSDALFEYGSGCGRTIQAVREQRPSGGHIFGTEIDLTKTKFFIGSSNDDEIALGDAFAFSNSPFDTFMCNPPMVPHEVGFRTRMMGRYYYLWERILLDLARRAVPCTVYLCLFELYRSAFSQFIGRIPDNTAISIVEEERHQRFVRDNSALTLVSRSYTNRRADNAPHFFRKFKKSVTIGEQRFVGETQLYLFRIEVNPYEKR